MITRITILTLLCVIGVNLHYDKPIKNPRIVVYKKARKLELYSDKTLVRSYRVGLGFNPIADKQREGEMVPERPPRGVARAQQRRCRYRLDPCGQAHASIAGLLVKAGSCH